MNMSNSRIIIFDNRQNRHKCSSVFNLNVRSLISKVFKQYSTDV